MSDPVIEKRDNHCFVSYASEDGALAQRIAGWLGEAGLSIWFDQDRLDAGASVVNELVRQVCNSRAFLLVATEKALTKKYVAHEVDIACEQLITQPGFKIIASGRISTRSEYAISLSPQSQLDVSAGGQARCGRGTTDSVGAGAEYSGGSANAAHLRQLRLG